MDIKWSSGRDENKRSRLPQAVETTLTRADKCCNAINALIQTWSDASRRSSSAAHSNEFPLGDMSLATRVDFDQLRAHSENCAIEIDVIPSDKYALNRGVVRCRPGDNECEYAAVARLLEHADTLKRMDLVDETQHTQLLFEIARNMGSVQEAPLDLSIIQPMNAFMTKNDFTSVVIHGCNTSATMSLMCLSVQDTRALALTPVRIDVSFMEQNDDLTLQRRFITELSIAFELATKRARLKREKAKRKRKRITAAERAKTEREQSSSREAREPNPEVGYNDVIPIE